MPFIHKGAISFGMVHIPIQLYRTTQQNDISFNQLCKDSKQRIRYKKICPNCNKEVKSEDIVKGYQYEKDKYVIIEDEEFEAIKTKQDRTIHILQFVSLDEIDDIYYEKNYYAIPEKGSNKAYELLRKAMQKMNVVAIAKTIIHTKETLLALCPTSDAILVKSLYYKDEIASTPVDITHPNIQKGELDMAKQLITSMVKPFDPSAFHDEYQERLYDMIMEKVKGHDVVYAQQEDSPKDSVMDLMEALQQSIQANKKPTKRKAVRH